MSTPHIVQTEQALLHIPILVLDIRYMFQVVMYLPMQTTRQCRTKTVVRCQKKRLACCVLDDGTCANLLSFVVVAVRWLVVVDANVTASRPPSCVIGNPGRQGRWSPLKRVIQAYLHPPPSSGTDMQREQDAFLFLYIAENMCIASPSGHASNNLLIATSWMRHMHCKQHSLAFLHYANSCDSLAVMQA